MREDYQPGWADNPMDSSDQAHNNQVVARRANSLVFADYRRYADYLDQIHDSPAAAHQAHSPAFADYTGYADQMHKSQATVRLAHLLAAPGSVADQDTDTAGEPVAPAVAAVRRFSLVSLFTAKLVPIICAAGVESKPGTHLGYRLFIF